MTPRARTAKTSASSSTSPSKSKRKSGPLRKITRSSTVQKKSPIKKSSPTKLNLEQTLSTTIQPRQKRLSSLTAATLLQYCTSILSPARKLKSTSKKTIDAKIHRSSTSKKRSISNVSEDKTELQIPIRARREASSRASAMIMQHNEIERSRYNYSLANEHSTASIRRHPSKSTVTNKDDIPPEPFQFNIPSAPPLPAPALSVANVSNQTEHAQSSTPIPTKSIHSTTTITSTHSKYPSLTEEILAEHNRLQETITRKHDNLLKWTEELASYGRLSPPYPEDEIPPELPMTKTTEKYSNSKEITPSILPVNGSLEHLPTTNNVTTPTFLFPSSAYSLDLRSFYSLLPCWQYPSWPFQSSAYQIPPSTIKRHHTSIHSETKPKKSPKLDSLISLHKQEKDALTFHLHTHHHHHIHNSKSSSLLKSTKTITTRSSPEKSSISINKNQLIENKTLLPLSVNNVIKKEDQSTSSTIEDEVLNLSINNKINSNETIKKSTRRKSSPVKRRINNGTKAHSLPSSSIVDKIPPTTDNSSVDNEKSIRRVPKRRSASAATTNSPTIVSIIDRNFRGKRTTSATTRKRSYSPASISLPLTHNHPRKKQKVLHYWILFGKSEQKLVSIDVDKPPVFRECYSSIRHITEKDVIKSDDCILLRSETGTHHGATPYLAKVKWFWEEPTTGEIQMSIIWYYHPEHTELPLRVRERFLSNELLASKYWDCVSVACIEDKCYVLNFNEYNRYCLREKSTNLFEHSEAVGQLKFLLNKNTSTVHHRPLPAKTVGNQNIFFCRYVYDYRAKRIIKNPTFVTTTSNM